ncbi:hypothetical protein ABWK46_15350 [Peribacillus frigoritolerans]
MKAVGNQEVSIPSISRIPIDLAIYFNVPVSPFADFRRLKLLDRLYIKAENQR